MRLEGAKGGATTRSLVLVLAVATLALTMALASPASPAFAADEENSVNEQQLPDSSFIYDTSIADLSGADAYFNNQTVQVTGEAIGDNIAADLDGSYRWVALTPTDGDSTISVYMAADDASRIDAFGAYGKTGTILKVRGTFHLACSEHDGLTDLHAEEVVVVKRGVIRASDPDLAAFAPGIACIVAGLLLMGLFYYLRERQR